MIKRYLRILNAEIKLNLKDTFSYKVGVLSDIIVMAILYFSCLFMNGYSSIGSYYSVQEDVSKSLVLQGYVFRSLAVLVLGSMSNSIRIDAIKGTLEQKAMSVVPLQYLFLGVFIANLLINIIVVAIICTISFFALNTSLFFDLRTILTLAIMLIGMYGVSLIFGGISLFSKRINNLVYIFQLILLIISNAVFQIDNVSNIAKIFPVTTGISIGRKYILGFSVPASEFAFFVFSSIFWLILGAFIFQILLHKTKYKGILSQY